MIDTLLSDGHVWLRITRPDDADPFDATFAQRSGGRWNPPDSWPTLYLNADLATVHAQVRHMFVGRAVEIDDLDDAAPIHLAAATLPRRQRVADVSTDAGVAAVGLASTYPLDEHGNLVGHDVTQPLGVAAHDSALRGVLCLSAALVSHETGGEELAWFPAPRAHARPHWDRTKTFGAWRYARTLDEAGKVEDAEGAHPGVLGDHHG